MIRPEDFRESLRSLLATNSRDWALDPADAWLWGVVHGWDLDPKDAADGEESAMAELATRHRWDDADVARLRRLHAQFDAPDSAPTVREAGRYGFLSSDGYPEEGPNPLITPTVREAGDEGIAALTDERNHWIGEGKRYERLYRSGREDASRWFKRMKVAEAKVARVEALADEWDETDGDMWDQGPYFARDLRAALAPETPEGDK